jgi:hypothetical protein
MKISKSVLKAVAVAVVVSAAVTACTKDNATKPSDDGSFKSKNGTEHYNCPACGMG